MALYSLVGLLQSSYFAIIVQKKSVLEVFWHLAFLDGTKGMSMLTTPGGYSSKFILNVNLAFQKCVWTTEAKVSSRM